MKSIAILFLVGLIGPSCEGTISGNSIAEANSTKSGNGVMESINPGRDPAMKSATQCGEIKFHYLVTQNELMSESVRQLTVFLDPTAFSEQNLQILFKNLSNKFAQPKGLVVIVETSWSRLALPDGCPIGVSSAPYDSTENDSHRAIFRRLGSALEFRYNPMLKTEKWKQVRLEE